VTIDRSRRLRRSLRSVLVVAVAVSLATGCRDGALAQDRACRQAVVALSSDLTSIASVSALDKSIGAGVVTTCWSRPEWRTSAKANDIATKLGRLRGVHDPQMRGTGVTALNAALAYLCWSYGPPGGTRACSDFN
jgi:hypothetical protein